MSAYTRIRFYIGKKCLEHLVDQSYSGNAVAGKIALRCQIGGKSLKPVRNGEDRRYVHRR